MKYEEALVGGDVSAGELETHLKEIVAVATAASVPITAIFFSGSVVGLSAAGITSGLAALGLGGILGLSAMVTGIGTVVVLGVTAYAATRWAQVARTGALRAGAHDPGDHKEPPGSDRRPRRRPERHRHKARRVHIQIRPERSKAGPSEERAAQMFTAALAELKQEKDNLQAQSA